MLPWFETDELHVEWQVWRFNKTIFELEVCQQVFALFWFFLGNKQRVISRTPCAPRPLFLSACTQPHQGVPRYVTQESEQHSDTIVRRGLVRAAANSRALRQLGDADDCS